MHLNIRALVQVKSTAPLQPLSGTRLVDHPSASRTYSRPNLHLLNLESNLTSQPPMGLESRSMLEHPLCPTMISLPTSLLCQTMKKIRSRSIHSTTSAHLRHAPLHQFAIEAVEVVEIRIRMASSERRVQTCCYTWQPRRPRPTRHLRLAWPHLLLRPQETQPCLRP
jgi:hypothetical protein